MNTIISHRQWSLCFSPLQKLVVSLLVIMLAMALGLERTRGRTIERLESSPYSQDWKSSKGSDAEDSRALSKDERLKSYGQLPLAFEANQGQSDRQVQFISRGGGFGLFLTSTEAVLALHQPVKQGQGMRDRTPLTTPSTQTRDAVLGLKLVGANATPQVMGVDELPGKVNYFIGDDPTKWHTSVPTYARVKYQDVYPGVDLVFHGSQQQLEYDFVVSPGANPGTIAMRFASKSLGLSRQGDLLLQMNGGNIVKPTLQK